MLFKDILSFKWWKIILIESRPWKVQWEIFFYVKKQIQITDADVSDLSSDEEIKGKVKTQKDKLRSLRKWNLRKIN